MDEKSLRIDGKAEREPSSSLVQNKSRYGETENKGDRKWCSCDEEIRMKEPKKCFPFANGGFMKKIWLIV